jgi:hypothetical protein
MPENHQHKKLHISVQFWSYSPGVDKIFMLQTKFQILMFWQTGKTYFKMKKIFWSDLQINTRNHSSTHWIIVTDYAASICWQDRLYLVWMWPLQCAKLQLNVSHVGGAMVNVLATGPEGHGFEPNQGSGFLRAIKVRSTPSFGWEVKPEVPCRKILWHVKDLLKSHGDE